MIVVTLYQSFCAMIFVCNINQTNRQDSVGNACFVHQATFSANFSIAFGSLAHPCISLGPACSHVALGKILTDYNSIIPEHTLSAFLNCDNPLHVLHPLV